MIATPHTWMFWCGAAFAAASAIYTVAAAIAVSAARRATRKPLAADSLPPVTILKPLCGAEDGLYECLRSFCDQAYPNFQIVFGVSQCADPAVKVVRQLQREFPALDLTLVVDRRQHGSSRKVSNLLNMMPLARHDYLVISDSDVRVDADYLRHIVPPLLDRDVGIVTCPYRGVPRAGLWSLLGALFINEWFIPSVRVAAMFGSRAFAFGATIAIRRDALLAIGGFASIANQLADDYRMGELTRNQGLRTVLSEVIVETYVDERSFGDLLRHELRWLRTIRAVRPLGYSLSFVTFGLPVAALGCVLAAGARPALALLAITAAARLMIHWSVQGREPARPGMWFMIPLRETLSFGLWVWGFATRQVHWRDDRYRVFRDGSAQPIVRISPSEP